MPYSLPAPSPDSPKSPKRKLPPEGAVYVDRWLARREWTAGRVFLFAWWGALLGVLYLSFAG